jgi:hypothetical protein
MVRINFLRIFKTRHSNNISRSCVPSCNSLQLEIKTVAMITDCTNVTLVLRKDDHENY